MLKSNEQRIAEMHKRAEMIEYNDKQSKARIYYICAGIVAAAAMFLIMFILPGVSLNNVESINGTGDVMYGSIFTDGDALKYIIVGICAFVLGVVLTIFCYRLNKWKKEEPKKGDK